MMVVNEVINEEINEVGSIRTLACVVACGSICILLASPFAGAFATYSSDL